MAPGTFPPTINTTPNSPTVWANVSASPASTPGHASGSVTRANVPSRDTPRHHDASTSRRSTAANAAANGRTANGRLNSTDPTSTPANVNGSQPPVTDSYPCPKTPVGPVATST